MRTAFHLEGLGRSKIRKMISMAPQNAINMALGELHFSLSDFLKEKAQNIIQNESLSYTTNQGLYSARNAVANYYKNSISPEQVVITCGAEEAIFTTLFAILNPDDEVLLADPTFLAYATIVRMMKAKPVYFNLLPDENFRIDFDNLKKKYTAKTKVLLLCNPSNPLSSVISVSDMIKLISFIEEKKLFVIVDEIYRDLFFKIRPNSLLELIDRCAVISGLSKSHAMTGWRIGWVVSQNIELMQKIVTVHQYICTCAPTLSQKMIQYCLSEQGLSHNKLIREELHDRKKIFLSYLLKDFTELSVHPTDFAPYCFIRINVDDSSFAKRAIRNGLIVIPGRAFGKNGLNYVRVCYSHPQEILFKSAEMIRNTLLNFL